MGDIVKFIKNLEKEFLQENVELYKLDRMEFLRKREAFVSEKMLELKNDEE
jgi:hypothetical protein|tara:strand:- start:1584 stop:1736 length:153 start_codon:yes stop_codon:yes gene_type:complete